MDFLAEITKQGFGYLLFGLACLVIVHLYRRLEAKEKENQGLSEKRVIDIVTMKDSYMDLAQASRDAQLTNANHIQELLRSQIQIASDLRNMMSQQGKV